MTSKTHIRRALISVSDKEGLVERAKRLATHGVDLVSTGGTARALKEAGLAVKDVADLTGYPEMMDGRVKTLHPAVHGGLLFLRNHEGHKADAKKHGIEAIDLVYINLYPFEATVASGAGFEDCIENIDIGGPAMLRAAAKNGDSVSVCTDGGDLDRVLAEMDETGGEVSRDTSRHLAAKTYARTAAYDAAISSWYARQIGETAPDWTALGGKLQEKLRYGENPHQNAAFYVTGEPRPGVATARQVQGKALSYNNINDTDAAYELIGELGNETPAVAIIKHANPCGVALGDTVIDAYREALACDSTSAFGGIVALNRPLDAGTATKITSIFTEVVIAPGADEAAIEIFAKKKNLRLLLTDGLPDPLSQGTFAKTVAGGLLVQDRDFGRIGRNDLKVVTKIAPSDKQLNDLLFAWRVAKHVKSNTIVYAKDCATVGIGAGQMSRIDSARIAARKAEDAKEKEGFETLRTTGCVAASDAFFPFPDGMLAAAAAGASAIIQPGGSIRDDDVIAAADEAGLAMVLTGMRHFRH
ncbi:MAG: bifunctional phosphoribosylaminoimidazolecarboxamide formyltransferase/IMP cyclohydrolase [Pseudomonadota bacterium]